MLGFPSVNCQGYLNFFLQLDSTSQHLFPRTLHYDRAQTQGILSTRAYQVPPFKPCLNLRKLLKQERRCQLQLVVALSEVGVWRETWQTRLEKVRVILGP